MDTITPERQAEITAAREADTRIAAAYDAAWEITVQVSDLLKRQKNLPQYASFRGMDWFKAEAAKIETELAALREKQSEARNAARELDESLYTGWTRFFLVQHIHNSMHCSSFRWNTRIQWLPDVSGLTEAEAVAEHGATLCTICFPTAPVALTQAKADPTVCAGSGKAIDDTKLTGRERAYCSPSGTCAEWGQAVALTARYSGKVRKHKAVA